VNTHTTEGLILAAVFARLGGMIRKVGRRKPLKHNTCKVRLYKHWGMTKNRGSRKKKKLLTDYGHGHDWQYDQFNTHSLYSPTRLRDTGIQEAAR